MLFACGFIKNQSPTRAQMKKKSEEETGEAMSSGGCTRVLRSKRVRNEEDGTNTKRSGEKTVISGGFEAKSCERKKRGPGRARKESTVESVEQKTSTSGRGTGMSNLRCHRKGNLGKWRCRERVLPGRLQCEKHYIQIRYYKEKQKKREEEAKVMSNDSASSSGLKRNRGEMLNKSGGFTVPFGGFEAAKSSETNKIGRSRKESGIEMSISGERKASGRRGRSKTVEHLNSGEEVTESDGQLVVFGEFPVDSGEFLVESVEKQTPTSGKRRKKVVWEEEQELSQQGVTTQDKINRCKVTEHSKSGQGTPGDISSSIYLLVGDPQHEDASSKALVDNIVPTDGTHSADQHLPISPLLEKSDFHPVSENRGEHPSTQSLVLQKTLAVVKCSHSLSQETISDEFKDTRNGQNERALHSVLVDVTRSSYSSSPRQGDAGDVSRSTLFVKSPTLLPLWESFHSKITFNSILQQPHFHKLEQYKEELREGLALGYMVSFANIIEKTRATTLDEPQSCLEDKLVALDELEELGFIVHPIRCRLQELLKIKENCIQLEDDSKAIERLVNEEKCKSGKLQTKIADLQKTINEVNEKLQSVKMEAKKKELYTSKLEKTTDEFRQRLQAVRLDFDRVVAAAL